jgi:peptidoglycan/xylan/chitin deacetylase (PgdA/CDA1 family)
MLAIKIDVDTHEGMKHGVPRLLDCFERHGLKGSFFLSMGPDRMGRALLQLRHPRFLRKMLTTNAPSLYGWRTIFSGTLLPARPIATAFPNTVRRIESDGHEAAIHCWDHRAWQDDLPRFKTHRIHLHYRRAVEAYRTLTGHDPAGIGAAAWMSTEHSLAIQDSYPFSYASDLRWSPACRLLTVDGERRLPQFPGTGPCLEELLGDGITDEAALADALIAALAADPGPLRVLTLHAEVEGGPFMPVLERLAPRLSQFGECVLMRDAAARLATTLPLRRWCRIMPKGRAFPVTSSQPF